MLKIAICTPCYGDVTADYASSLAKLVLRTGQTQVSFNGELVFPQIEVFMRSSSVLPQLRNMLVKDAIEWNAHFLLWLDADQKFPEDALLRLLSLGRSVVGANYPRRVPPHRPTAVGLDGRLVCTTEEKAKAQEIVQVASLGFGCCLMDMTILDRLHHHALGNGQESFWPLFAVEMVGDGTEIIGEDAFFFRQLRAADVDVYLDHPLSWSIGHVHQRVLTNADTRQDRPQEQRTSLKVTFEPHHKRLQ